MRPANHCSGERSYDLIVLMVSIVDSIVEIERPDLEQRIQNLLCQRFNYLLLASRDRTGHPSGPVD